MPNAYDWSTWEAPLRQFAAATKLVVSAFDAEGRRTLGPFAFTRLGEQLISSSAFSHDGSADRMERLLAEGTRSAPQATALFEDQLRVCAIPIQHGDEAVGAIVFGWTLADFATNVGCERVARSLELDGRKLWSAARLDSPVSQRRFDTYRTLLRTLVDAGLQLRQAISELERLSQAREMFLAHVSHELRTPLHAISMRLEMLLRSPLDDPNAIRQSLDKMRRNVGEESRLIEDLLEAAVTRTGRFTLNKTPADLAVIARAARDAIAPTAEERGINLTFNQQGTEASLPLVADAPRLQQALWNIIANAVKFTPPGGRVEVRASSRDCAYAIEIIDDGPGIAPEALPHIFEAFSRSATRNSKGLGLGLSIAKQIVNLHGGSIAASSSAFGKGTTFTIVVPFSSVPMNVAVETTHTSSL
jgi:signal transduction histidine kinase